jgi:hypothetical protein
MAVDAVSYESLGARVAPEWMGQLADVDATRWWSTSQPYMLQIEASWPSVIASAVRLMDLLVHLPRLPILTPPPSQWSHDMAATFAESNASSGLLAKVRALLAKAESTPFDAEAEALTAKAQSLMARHRIDHAVLHASVPSGGEQPAGRRITIDDPYAEAKAALLDGIANANGGHAVWGKRLGFSTVFAFPDELLGIEALFTSLLVQSTAALQREGSKVDGGGHSRTTRFRRSFLVAFAVRIGNRLAEAVAMSVTEAEAATRLDGGDAAALVPILADRDDAARAAAAEAFPHSGTYRPSATDREGWFAGTAFGDLADVGRGDALDRRTAS